MKADATPTLILWFLLLANHSFGHPDNSSRFVIKKCCPKDEHLHENLECVKTSKDETSKFKYDVKKENPSKGEHDPFVALTGKGETTNSSTTASSFKQTHEWFPLVSFLNATTLEPILNNTVVEDVLSSYHFEYGKSPDCHVDSMDTACFKDEVSQFRLLLYPSNEIRLYVSKKSSYHDKGYFRVETGRCSTKSGNSSVDDESDPLLEDDDVFEIKAEYNTDSLRTFPMEDVCIDSNPIGRFMVVYCPCKTASCVRKCCPDLEVYDDVTGECIKNSLFPNWRPYLDNSSLSRNYYLLTGTPPSSCDKPNLLKIPIKANNTGIQGECFNLDRYIHKNSFLFLEDGSVQINKFNFPLSPDSYCGEHTLHNEQSYVENNLFYCVDTKDLRPAKFDIYGVVFILGGFVLLLTVAISLYLPELRTSVYYKIIICHNVSLMLASFTWGTTNLLSSISYGTCVFLSLLIQFTFLGSFFWMNVMCIDISFAFRSVRGSVGTSVRNSRKFLWYSFYAWGGPVVITCATAAMELAPYVPPQLERPRIGCRNCGFDSETSALLIYFYGPMIAILVFNLILFVLTIIRILQIQKDTAILNSKGGFKKSSAFNSDKQRLVLFSKLFLLMGLTWSMEIVSWAVGGPSYYWYIPDFINFLRAFFIFVIFICKRTVLCSLLIKLGKEDWADMLAERKISTASSRLSETSVSRNRRSRNSTTDKTDAEVERRGRILQKQITQTIRNSDESHL